MPEWITAEFGLASLVVGAVVYVATTYIKTPKPQEEDETSYCSVNMIPYMRETLKSNTELLTLLKQQGEDFRRSNEEFRRSSEKQQEAMQGMILAINNLVALSQETLSRVKELNK